ncbi:MAG: helicase C-terminal domain-containing protein [Candidatus Promineifilaceae bacterium]
MPDKDAIVVVDLETTGLDPRRDSIIEVAAVTVAGGRIADEWSSLVDPGRPLPAYIASLTGISQEMLAGAPDMGRLRPTLRAILGERPIAGHNVEFDLAFLQAENLALGNRRLDTLSLASILLPRAGRYSLAALSRLLALPSAADGRAHRALYDARRTAELWLALGQLAREINFDSLAEIVAAGRSIGWPETTFFERTLGQAARAAFSGEARRPAALFSPAKVLGRQPVAAEEPEPVDGAEIAGLLGPGGAFSRHFAGFEHRPQQLQMLAAVTEAFNAGQHLLVEAGTGTGKSIGYLLPAAYWAAQNGRRVVVSTNTINLQDQLVHKDLPELERLLPFELRSAILKGRRNYVCTRLLTQMRHSGPGNADEMALLARILLWLPQSQSGDLSEISLRTAGERLAWNKLSADNDVCTADRCAQENCPLHVARRRAELAHVVVVNHALLLADVAVANRILPSYTDLIVDEAHHLEGAVTDGLSFRGERAFLQSLLEEVSRPRAGLVADLQRRLAAAAPAEISSVVDAQAERLRQGSQNALLSLDEFFQAWRFFLAATRPRPGAYAEQLRLTSAQRVQPGYDEVEAAWAGLEPSLRHLAEGVGRLAGALADISESYEVEDAEDLRLSLLNLARQLEEARANLDALVARPLEAMIYWCEWFGERISLHAAPLDVGPLVEEHIFNPKETVILTSATLRTARPGGDGRPSFNYLRRRLHADHADEVAVGSPFDYETSTLVYLPTDIPEPNQPGYQSGLEEAIFEVARALGGRSLGLFTSKGHLATTAQAVEPRLAEAGIGLLAQTGGASRQQLLEAFRAEDSRSVLLGTRSFWEGVDVPGPALQAVLIARLPFDVPSDPIFAARAERYDNPFFEYSIPEAVLRFRQGFGRLIRRQDDAGIVVVLDKRILTKRYGQAFLDALPACTVLRQRLGRLGELSRRWLDRV